MRTSRFTEAQIVAALRQAEGGVAVAELCRKLEVTETTFYRWKRQYGGMGVSELRELRQLRDDVEDGIRSTPRPSSWRRWPSACWHTGTAASVCTRRMTCITAWPHTVDSPAPACSPPPTSPPRSASSATHLSRPRCPPRRGSTLPNSSRRRPPHRTCISKLRPPGVSYR